eukprot:408514_1
MSLKFKNVKYIDSRVKTIVYGYIKRAQQLLSHPSHKISELIIYSIILYYDELEQFDKKRCGPSIKISDDKHRTITLDRSASRTWQTVFGKKKINPESDTIIKYKFKINNAGYDHPIVFGFAANADNFSTNGSVSGCYGTYAIRSDGTQYADGISKQKSSLVLEKGDKLTITLDLSSNKLWFQKGEDWENHPQIVFLTAIKEYNYMGYKIIYKMFVELWNGDNSVTLLHVEVE